MHDGPIPLGDSWLAEHLEPYLQWASANNSLFILTWDEGHNGTDNRIVTVFVGPMVRPGEYCERINHYHTLRTLLDMYGLASIDKAATVDPITSVWAPESVHSPLSITLTSSADGLVLAEPATITLQAEVASADSTVSRVEFYQRSTHLGDTTNQPFRFQWSGVPAGSYCVVAKARDALGRSRTSLSIPVEVRASDLVPPSVSVTAPAPKARLTNGLATLQGTASDNVAVQRVEYRVGDGPVQLANGTTNWTAQVELPPGPSIVQVWSVDMEGNRSMSATRSMTYVVLSLLTTEISGHGAILPNLNGQNLEVGRSYAFKPVPEPGYVFAEPGVGAASAKPFQFIMESNLLLKLSFVPNPFPPVAGTYQGLIYDTNQVTPQSSGFFSLTLNPKGGYSARIELGRLALRAGGSFDAFGHASSVLSQRGPGFPLTADWKLDLTNDTDQIHGLVSNGSQAGNLPFAEIFGDRDVFTPATNDLARAGQYTIIFPHDTNGLASPEGDGFGAVTVDKKGRIRLNGVLADGTKVTQSATMSKGGQWPLYVPLNGGEGTFLGWIGFPNEATNGPAGLVNWITPGRRTAKFYPDGFTNESLAFGSSYHPPSGSGTHVLNLTNAVVIFEAGSLLASFTNKVLFEANDTISNQSSNRLTLAFTKQTGLWRGTVLDPATAEPIRFQGAVQQAQRSGNGFFLTTNKSGRVRLGSE
jgi:hypothetical protein